jgi:hypothetical protein
LPLQGIGGEQRCGGVTTRRGTEAKARPLREWDALLKFEFGRLRTIIKTKICKRHEPEALIESQYVYFFQSVGSVNFSMAKTGYRSEDWIENEIYSELLLQK